MGSDDFHSSPPAHRYFQKEIIWINDTSMQLQAAQVIVRSGAMLTALLALWALAVIASWTVDAVVGFQSGRLRMLLACGLFSIVPLMFVWASFQAWRFLRKGIVSL